jgi:hypothetical protein
MPERRLERDAWAGEGSPQKFRLWGLVLGLHSVNKEETLRVSARGKSDIPTFA